MSLVQKAIDAKLAQDEEREKAQAEQVANDGKMTLKYFKKYFGFLPENIEVNGLFVKVGDIKMVRQLGEMGSSSSFAIIQPCEKCGEEVPGLGCFDLAGLGQQLTEWQPHYTHFCQPEPQYCDIDEIEQGLEELAHTGSENLRDYLVIQTLLGILKRLDTISKAPNLHL